MQPTLLLADDSITIQRVVELTFADEDIHVVAVGDGDEAIRLLDQHPPAIVLADVGMPGRNGYDIARHVRTTPSLARIPVLLLTGAFEPVDHVKVAEAGCDGVLAKPFEPQVVVAKVRELLARAKETTEMSPSREVETPSSVDTYLDRLGGALTGLAVGRGPRPTEAEPPSVDLAAARAAAMAAVTGAVAVPVEVRQVERVPQRSAPALAPLGDAFAALLAAEQSAPVPPQPAAWPAVPVAARPSAASAVVPSLPADLVEQVTRRVLDQLSDQVVRETVTDIVSNVAERLVREEIERIKRSIDEKE